MKKLRKKVYMTAGYNTISLGTGRKEFHPSKERPGIEYYIAEAGRGTLSMIGGADNVDEGVFGNFIADQFCRQNHIAAFLPMIDEKLKYKPSTRTEGACCSGGLALMAGMRSVLAETADVVLTVGVEVQNTMKAMYVADVLATAGYYKNRKAGHAYFFPGQFSNRAGAYYEKFGREYARKGFARWYRNAIENARLCPTAQEYHNTIKDLEAAAMTEPNPKGFLDFLTVYDCSKVSDAGCAIAIVSEDGLKKIGIKPADAVEVIGFGQAENDITQPPEDLTVMDTTREAVKKALEMAGISIHQVGTIEMHDCFTAAGILGIEAMGLAGHGKGAGFVYEGNTARDGIIPVNTTGGLIGWGHPTGGTGVHQANTIWEQLTGRAGDAQVNISPDRPFGLTVNMGGDDKTLAAIVYKRGE